MSSDLPTQTVPPVIRGPQVRVNRVKKWLIVLTGFLQTRGRPSGMTRLWLDLGHHHTRDTKVLLVQWSEDVEDYAEMIWAIAQDCNFYFPSIRVFGYSWGGASAIQLARALGRRGLTVDVMVLSDAVYRHWWIFRRWTSLLSWMVLTIPKNVKRVTWFHQRVNRPFGHKLICEDPQKTALWPADGQLLEVSHQYMDDALEFRQECSRVAAA